MNTQTKETREAAHTPGPWQVCRNPGYNCPAICGPKGFDDPTIALLVVPCARLSAWETPEMRADAKRAPNRCRA